MALSSPRLYLYISGVIKCNVCRGVSSQFPLRSDSGNRQSSKEVSHLNIITGMQVTPQTDARVSSADEYDLTFTLNLCTSSIFACLPSETQVWKKLGATETPSASDVIPVW